MKEKGIDIGLIAFCGSKLI